MARRYPCLASIETARGALLTVKVVRVDSVGVVDFSVVNFEAEAYYGPILEYNLFRPLGWTPKRSS